MKARRNQTYKIGITGNICTGKTLVRHILQSAGVSTMDAEETALGLLEDNPSRLSIRLTEHFGNEVLDARGRLSRKKLNAILYTDPAKKAFFDEKLNPFLREEVKHFLYSPMGTNIRAVETPMLLETDTQHLYDEVWIVLMSLDRQVECLMTRDSLSRGEAQQVVNAQWPQEKKAALCQRVIFNTATPHMTETQVREALEEIKHRVFKVRL